MKEKNDIYILGIESSCDETSASVVKNGREVLSLVINSQIEEHKKYGGVVPEIASRMHVEAISFVVEEALEKANITLDKIDGIAVTKGPGLVGALLVGVSFAKSLAYANNIKLVPVNHLAGHIAGNYLTHKKLEPPYLALIVSGGHTHLVHVKSYTEYEVIAKTRDDAVGEAFDKIARVIGLGYPGGPKVDKLAKEGIANIIIPKPKMDNLDFSFSGIKTHIINLNHNKKDIVPADLCMSFEKTVTEILIENVKKALTQLNLNTVAISGGVSANSYIRESFAKLRDDNIFVYFPEFVYCTDNAAMIASQGYFNYIENNFADLALNAKPNLKINEK